MRAWGVAALVLALTAHSAAAAGYDDFARGMTASLRGESDAAIKAFTAALGSADLVPAYKPAALRGRAIAYLQKEKCAEALADLNAFTALKGPSPDVTAHRLKADFCLKDLPSARKDFDALAGAQPTALDVWDFARFEWYSDFFAEASDDALRAFKAADKKNNATPYMLLWYAIGADRLGKLDPAVIAAGKAELNLDDWPAALFDLYLGKLEPTKVRSKASAWKDAVDAGYKCEADFYTAEWYLARKNDQAATPLLRSAAKNCSHDFIEYSAAANEMKRLGLKE